MSLTRSIGKNTLGGGKKIQVDMRTYNRSTHDLSYVWRNTQSPGTLVPFICELALPGDVHEIQLSANVLTHPTVGPLFRAQVLNEDRTEWVIMIGDKLASKELFADEEQIKKYIDKKPWELIAALICSITDNAIKSELSNLKNKEK